jgi:hypothetical protein
VPLLLAFAIALVGDRLYSRIVGDDGVVWAQILDEPSFYIALILTAVLTIYQVQISKFDNELAKGFTPKQYEATIRNNVAEDVANRSKKLIAEGKIDQLEKETETFQRLYGKNKS